MWYICYYNIIVLESFISFYLIYLNPKFKNRKTNKNKNKIK